jgi:alkylation response protein AidB-like acyl-CoA dehydrogenase
MARKIVFGVALFAFVILEVNYGLLIAFAMLAVLAVYIGWGLVRWVWRQAVEYVEFRREEQRRLSGRQ